uniref:Uncharacterized protein n=1 Tax=Physcomitrium patens TaxID=3218 RepID=A0A2K1L2W0_PHYPA|nr:hypothetical protein PHYPA_003155 [Physcomitrium patens]
MLHPGHCFCCLQFQISSSDNGYLSSFRILYPVLLVGWFLMPDNIRRSTRLSPTSKHETLCDMAKCQSHISYDLPI